ncbi:hypothetical protein V501_01622 [Pseudogymnoascus sp. VKM F-4519 (FW-2642)]|nr:hypothetical protein V501_01622 [Pseudogymnoascus sp. VKM F-4519 (FW-2642)]
MLTFRKEKQRLHYLRCTSSGPIILQDPRNGNISGTSTSDLESLEKEWNAYVSKLKLLPRPRQLPWLIVACYYHISSSIPKFAGYIKHAMVHRETARDYWRSFLHGSRITKMRPSADTTKVHNKACLSGELIKLKQTCPAPRCRNGLTPATLFTALSACALARSTKSSDVVFGLLVSGRSMLPSGLQDVIGPCLNYIPIRVRFADDGALEFALKCVEEQRLRGLPFETSQFNDIAGHCTDWPGPPKDFGVVVQYQNIKENPTADISGENSRQRARGGFG